MSWFNAPVCCPLPWSNALISWPSVRRFLRRPGGDSSALLKYEARFTDSTDTGCCPLKMLPLWLWRTASGKPAKSKCSELMQQECGNKINDLLTFSVSFHRMLPWKPSSWLEVRCLYQVWSTYEGTIYISKIIRCARWSWLTCKNTLFRLVTWPRTAPK